MKYPKLLKDGDSFVYYYKGKLSERYYRASAYEEGFAVVQKRINGPYYFRDAKGNLSEGFERARNYHDGLAIVRIVEGGLYYYRDVDGNLSKEGFWNAYDYREGFATVQKENGGPMQFRDTKGNLSEEGFHLIGDYYEGFAWVQKKPLGPIYYRDAEGNVSEEGFHYCANHYVNGFVRVQKKEDGPYYYRDAKGNLSKEGFVIAGDYREEGIALVRKEEFSQWLYRDIGGNLYRSEEEARISSQKIRAEQSKAQESTKKSIPAKGDNDTQKSTPVEVKSSVTEKGLLKRQIKQRNGQEKTKSTPAKGGNYAKIEDYFKNKVSVYSLSPEDIYTYLNKIVAWEKYNIKLEMENADRDAGAEILKEARITADYIKQTAYEYSEELKNRKPLEIEEDIYQLF